jgi:hypothetical protein
VLVSVIIAVAATFLSEHYSGEAAARAELAAWEEGAEGARYQYFYSTPS